jgi:hypothetical protein
MIMDQFSFTKFSKKMLEECQKLRDENYERNTKKANHVSLGTMEHK